MTPVELSRTVLHAVRRAVDGGELRVSVPERVLVTEPGPGGCGDFATNVALQLARPAGQPPRRVAEILRPHLVEAEGIQDVVVTGPGFLNISLGENERGDLAAAVVREIRERGAGYGHSDALAGQVVVLRVPYEVRAEVVADAVARIVATQGGRVEIEHGEPVNLRPVPAPEDPAPLGADAAQWALLHPASHDRPRITADHLVQRESNPLFRVRYAHARTRALTRNAARLGFAAEPGALGLDQDLSDVARSGGEHVGLPHLSPGAPHATPLLTPLTDHPRILTAAATHRAPDRLARHLVTVADAVLPLLPFVLPCGEEKPSAAHRARLALAEAAGTVLAGGLSLLGIDAPEHL
ncbi:ArgS-related anticodon-binding protein NrtL [Streptomyces sp. NPDC047085]|uniref:ArgS-related anticodon-binding protein NrtL n=1 Tax=Streptomyces sp. NPDC047085 TaxID=3155140 RepID=UPI0033FBAA65